MDIHGYYIYIYIYEYIYIYIYLSLLTSQGFTASCIARCKAVCPSYKMTNRICTYHIYMHIHAEKHVFPRVHIIGTHRTPQTHNT